MLLGRQWRCIDRISLGLNKGRTSSFYHKWSAKSEVLESVYILRDITIDGKYSNYNVKH